jgi:uncharacterized cupin superfamily protein
MVHVGSGIFVSNVDTARFEPDLEIGGAVHWLRRESGPRPFEAGLWRANGEASERAIPWTFPANETVYVLGGEAEVRITDGPTVRLAPGDMASFPGGLHSLWQVGPTLREFFVVG